MAWEGLVNLLGGTAAGMGNASWEPDPLSSGRERRRRADGTYEYRQRASGPAPATAPATASSTLPSRSSANPATRGLPTSVLTPERVDPDRGFGGDLWDAVMERGRGALETGLGAASLARARRLLLPESDEGDARSAEEELALRKVRDIYAVGGGRGPGVATGALARAAEAPYRTLVEDTVARPMEASAQALRAEGKARAAAAPRPGYAESGVVGALSEGRPWDALKTAVLGAAESTPAFGAMAAAGAVNPIAGLLVAKEIEGGGAYDQALDAGATEEEAQRVSSRTGLANMALEYAPAGKLLGALKGAAPGVRRSLLRRVVAQAVAEGTTEFGQGMSERVNLALGVARENGLTGEEAMRYAVESLDEAISGGLMGGAAGALTSTATPSNDLGASQPSYAETLHNPAQASGIAELARRSQALADGAIESNPVDVPLRVRAPRWASSLEEAAQNEARWLAARRRDFTEDGGGMISPEDVPFELADLPLTQDEDGLYKIGVDPDGGATRELYTPQLPMVYVEGWETGDLEREATVALAETQGFDSVLFVPVEGFHKARLAKTQQASAGTPISQDPTAGRGEGEAMPTLRRLLREGDYHPRAPRGVNPQYSWLAHMAGLAPPTAGPPVRAVGRARAEPLPLPKLEGVTPEQVSEAWAIVSARYPLLASRVKQIKTTNSPLTAGMVENVAAPDTIQVNVGPLAALDRGTTRIPADLLLHELAHIGQMRNRGLLDSDFAFSEGQAHKFENAYRGVRSPARAPDLADLDAATLFSVAAQPIDGSAPVRIRRRYEAERALNELAAEDPSLNSIPDLAIVGALPSVVDGSARALPAAFLKNALHRKLDSGAMSDAAAAELGRHLERQIEDLPLASDEAIREIAEFVGVASRVNKGLGRDFLAAIGSELGRRHERLPESLAEDAKLYRAHQKAREQAAVTAAAPAAPATLGIADQSAFLMADGSIVPTGPFHNLNALPEGLTIDDIANSGFIRGGEYVPRDVLIPGVGDIKTNINIRDRMIRQSGTEQALSAPKASAVSLPIAETYVEPPVEPSIPPASPVEVPALGKVYPPGPGTGLAIGTDYEAAKAQLQQTATLAGYPPELVREVMDSLARQVHGPVAQAARAVDDPTLHALADTTEKPQPYVAPPLKQFKPSEAGFILIPGRRRPAAAAPASPPPLPPSSPMDGLIAYGPPSKEPIATRLRRAYDRWIDEMSDKEDAPIRILRRAGMAREARTIERYIARARGAAAVARLPIFSGVYKFDPATGNTVRTHDSYASIVAGMDAQGERDLNDYMAATHHMELVERRERARLQDDWDRAARLAGMRAARRADRESLRRMVGDVRDARAAELREVRRAARAAGQAQGRQGGVQALVREADALSARAGRLEDEAALAAQRTLESGFDEASAEFAVAASYARRLVEQELGNAVRRPGRGSTLGLTQKVKPRSPRAMATADDYAYAMARAAEKLGIDEGRMRALVAGARSMRAGASSLTQTAWDQAEGVGNATARAADGELAAVAAGAQTRHSLDALRRVAMGIRDDATSLRRRFPPITPRPDSSLDIDDRGTAAAEAILADLKARYGAATDARGRERVATLNDLAAQVRSWSIAAVIDQLDSIGYFKPGQRAALEAKNEEYAPLFRMLDEIAEDADSGIPEPLRGDAGQGRGPVAGGSSTSPIKRISGGLSPDRPVAPPLESFVAQAQRIAVWVERQRVRNLMADFADANPDALRGETQRVAPGAKGSGPGTSYTAFRNGERHLYAATPELMSVMERATPRQASLFLQAGAAMARMLRAGATLMPDFAVRNFLRDQMAAGVYGVEFRYKPFAGFVEGLVAQIPGLKGLHESVAAWEASGGALADAISIERPDVRFTATQARLASPGARAWAEWKAERNVVAKVLWPVLKPLEMASGTVEKATRIGAYRQAKRAGANDLDAAFFSRNITLDFGRSGSTAQRWNSYEAFANASLQDVARFSRAMRERPVATTISALATITLPTLAAYWGNQDDEDYATLPEWEKAAFLHAAKRDDGTWWRIPRPQGLLNAFFGYGVQKALETATADGHGEAVTELLATLFHETPLRFSPAQPDPGPGGTVAYSNEWLPSAIQPAAEAGMNFSSFRQAPIVPAGMAEGTLPEDRAADTTTGTARWLGRKLDAAPLKIDYLIRGYGAGLTHSMLKAGEAAAVAAGVEMGGPDAPPPLPRTLKDVPGVGGLISTSSWGFASKPVQDLYALQQVAADAAGSLKLAAEQGRVWDCQRIAREHPEAWVTDATGVKVTDRLEEARRDLKALRDKRKEIRNLQGIDDAYRADALLQIDQTVTQIAAGTMHWASDTLRRHDSSTRRTP